MPGIVYNYHLAGGPGLVARPAGCAGGAVEGAIDILTAAPKVYVGAFGGNAIVGTWPQFQLATLTTRVGPGVGWLFVREQNWRINSFRVACQQGGFGLVGQLTRSQVQQDAETTEKTQLAYSMGSTFTALLAERVAGVLGGPANFMHLNVFTGGGGALALVVPGGQRPDYVSRIGGVGPYQVWEAKGSGGGVAGGLLTTGAAAVGPALGTGGQLNAALIQLNNVATVGAAAAAPDAMVACMARGYNTGAWEMHVSDPSSISGSYKDSPEENDALFRAYYGVWLRTLMFFESRKQFATRTFAEQEFYGFPLTASDSLVGIDARLVKIFMQLSPSTLDPKQKGKDATPGELSDALLDVLRKPGYSGGDKSETQAVNSNGLFTLMDQSVVDSLQTET